MHQDNTWNLTANVLPEEEGLYHCKDGIGEYTAFYVRNGRGEKMWLTSAFERIPTHSKQKIENNSQSKNK